MAFATPPHALMPNCLTAFHPYPPTNPSKGEYQDKPKLPFVPGSEVSGVVVEVAPGIKHLGVGDKVRRRRRCGCPAAPSSSQLISPQMPCAPTGARPLPPLFPWPLRG